MRKNVTALVRCKQQRNFHRRDPGNGGNAIAAARNDSVSN
jgi:hypothetical protein